MSRSEVGQFVSAARELRAVSASTLAVPVKLIPCGEGSVIVAMINSRYFPLDALGILPIWNDLDSKFELSAGNLIY